EFGVALVDDQVHQGVAHVLRGNLAHVLPLTPPFIGSELDLLGLDGAIKRVKPKFFDLAVVHANFFAPLVEQADPVTKCSDLWYFSRHEKRAPSFWLLAFQKSFVGLSTRC